MARHGPQSHGQPLQEEDYIDMDLSSPAAAAMASAAPHSREFEFHTSAQPDQREALASPADELFYKGKLLPLHLPRRIQMVEELLGGAAGRGLLAARTAPATPYESRNASPAKSRYVSGGLRPEEYFQDFTAGLTAACEKKPWSMKLKFVRQLNLGLKLKASKTYIKTMFAAKTGSPDDKSDMPRRATGISNGHSTTWRKNPFGQIRSHGRIASQSSNSTATLGEKLKEHKLGGHRRSFSSVIIRYSTSNKTSSASSSSSSSSSNSSSFLTASPGEHATGPVLRRSSSASSDMESPIQGAIAYCKKSQQLASVRKTASDAGFRFMSPATTKIAAESEDPEETIELCRG